MEAVLVPVEEYLNTSYHPDVEYVDGVLVERNVGDWNHSWTQRNILLALRLKSPRLKTVPALRSKVTATRYRLPDVCAVLEVPETRYLLDAAYLVVEVLSADDSMTEVMERLNEFAAQGVANIWVVDPRLKKMFVYMGVVLEEVQGSISTRDGEVKLTAEDIFAGL